MAVSLYRQGTTHTIRETLCEMEKFQPDEVHIQLKNGWFKAPIDAYALQIEEQEEAEEIKEVLSFEYMRNVEIRDAARKAGLEKWETARIETLKEALI